MTTSYIIFLIFFFKLNIKSFNTYLLGVYMVVSEAGRIAGNRMIKIRSRNIAVYFVITTKYRQ